MFKYDALFLNPYGTDEIPTPNFEQLIHKWDPNIISFVRIGSTTPFSYGNSDVFMNGFAVAVSLTPTRRRTIVDGKVIYDGWAPPGAIRVRGPGEDVVSEVSTEFDHISMYIPEPVFHSILQDHYQLDSDGFALLDPKWGVDDVVHSNLLSAMSAAKDKQPASLRYLNSLARAVTTHVIYRYSNIGGKIATAEHANTAVMRTVMYFIDKNIEQNLKLADLAKVAGQSPDQFRREFKNYTKMSPHQYLIKERIALACKLMSTRTRPKLSAIALECGFADQSHLSTTFRKVMGISPARFLKQS